MLRVERPGAARAVAAAAFAAIAAGVAVLLKRTKRPGGSPAATELAAGPQTRDWSCECGQAYRVNGAGRHQVFWLEGADERDPLLDDRCPSCERPLPASA